MKMRGVEKRFVNSRRHSSRVASQAEQRLCPIQTLPGQRLLDVGCGNGAAPIHLARTFGLEIVGVDVDPEQIEAAIAASSDVADCGFLAADATELPFADGKFDLVHASKTTHHIHDWPQAFAEMARVLKPGGHLAYSDLVAPLGHRLPTRRTLNAAATRYGLQQVRHSGSPFHYTAVYRKPSATTAVKRHR